MDPALDLPRTPTHPKHPYSNLEIGEESEIRRITWGTNGDIKGEACLYISFYSPFHRIILPDRPIPLGGTLQRSNPGECVGLRVADVAREWCCGG